jgi:ABC-type protease/lipase transport system fused ATPase/permease subunit
MNKINCKKEIHVVFGILSIFGAILISTTGVLNSVYGQVDYSSNQTNTPAAATSTTTNATSTPAITTATMTNSTANQTNTPAAATTTNASNATTAAKQEASNSIKGVINEAGQFLSNAAQKLTTSKSAGALLNDTSDALGNAYVETKKFFSPN